MAGYHDGDARGRRPDSLGYGCQGGLAPHAPRPRQPPAECGGVDGLGLVLFQHQAFMNHLLE